MSLTLVATPIGHPQDITLRAIETLKSADVVIVEEFRPLTTLLKRLGIEKPQLEQLNEHSKSSDVDHLVTLCREKNVALVSDCGTPGFCDPGADLVRLCRKANIPITSTPGPSSLMTLLSLTGVKTSEFLFRGFPPAKKEERIRALKDIAREPRAQILMDTPYRLGKLLSELNQLCPERTGTLGLSLTQEDEQVVQSTVHALHRRWSDTKAEFLLMLHSLPEI